MAAKHSECHRQMLTRATGRMPRNGKETLRASENQCSEGTLVRTTLPLGQAFIPASLAEL